MSRLRDYLNLVKEGLPNTDKIAGSLLNQVKQKFGKLSLEEQEEIVRRQLICHSCPFYSLNAKENPTPYKELMKEDFEFDNIRNTYCSICGCLEKTKTYSLSASCGLEYYNNKHPENLQTLKWEPFTKTNNK